MKRWVFILGCIVMITRSPMIYRRLLANQASIQTMKAISHPWLDYHTRIRYLEEILLIVDENWVEDPFTIINISVEREELARVYEYLRANGYDRYEPANQLFNNPEFIHGTIGWIEYGSSWESRSEFIAGKYETVVSFSREGDGHSSISQVLELKSGKCYLLSVIGSVERRDDIPTFWLYWETYETGKPVGKRLISGLNDQPWQQRSGVFCLSPGELPTQQVVVAPVNVYGDVTVYLGTARLYELKPPQQYNNSQAKRAKKAKQTSFSCN